MGAKFKGLRKTLIFGSERQRRTCLLGSLAWEAGQSGPWEGILDGRLSFRAWRGQTSLI